MVKIKLGFASTRRSIFGAPDALKYRGLTADRLRELEVDFVDIEDINEEGLLYNEEDRLKVLEKFLPGKDRRAVFAPLQFWYGICLRASGKGFKCPRPAVGLAG